ncbi:hypothetical protein CNR22_08210 [Sphingobacteriaceae bacterium]|nr:hypothetical protein CNR22_08210 [Sphingobacteriaceae bacterium]
MKLDNLSIFEFAQKIKRHYRMYFEGTPRFSDLYNLIRGYSVNPATHDNPPLDYLNVWVKKKFNKWGASMDWAKAILEECDNDQEKAFWKYLDLLEEFHQIKPLKIYTTNLADEDLAKFYSTNGLKTWSMIGPENRRLVEPAPYHIKLIEFEYCTHSYHFDYYYVVSNTDIGRHKQSFSTLKKCFQYYEACFGKLKWEELPIEKVVDEFESVAKNCDHGNSIHHYMDGTYDAIGIK